MKKSRTKTILIIIILLISAVLLINCLIDSALNRHEPRNPSLKKAWLNEDGKSITFRFEENGGCRNWEVTQTGSGSLDLLSKEKYRDKETGKQVREWIFESDTGGTTELYFEKMTGWNDFESLNFEIYTDEDGEIYIQSISGYGKEWNDNYPSESVKIAENSLKLENKIYGFNKFGRASYTRIWETEQTNLNILNQTVNDSFIFYSNPAEGSQWWTFEPSDDGETELVLNYLRIKNDNVTNTAETIIYSIQVQDGRIYLTGVSCDT